MKSILIIGAGPLQVPGYIAAKQLGLRVIGLDRNPAAPGFRLADASFCVDTRDAQGAINVAHKERVSGVMTLCTDFPVLTVATVAHALGLPGLAVDTARRATHKGLMREAFAIGRAPIPRYIRLREKTQIKEAVEYIGLPAIIKPSLSSGSRGVFKLEHYEQLDAACEHAFSVDPGEEILVEEFVDGPEVSVECVSFRGEHKLIAITDKITTGDPHWVELGHTQPSALPIEIQNRIRSCAVQGLDALGIMDSASHIEIKIGRQGPVLIEIGARLGGDYISTELTYRSTGVDMARAAVQIALGEKPDVEPRWHRGSAIRYIKASPGRVKAIHGVESAKEIPGVAIVEVYPAVGDEVREIRSSLDRVGHVIADGATREEVVHAAERAVGIIDIETEHG